MKTIGIISNSSEAVNRIVATAAPRFRDIETNFQSFLYKNPEDIADIFLTNRRSMDGWIFSGQNPYNFAKPYITAEDNVVFCPVTGVEIYKYFLEHLAKNPQKKLRISVDGSADNSLFYQTTLNELNIDISGIFYHEYPAPTTDIIAETIQHHLALWQSGKIDLILTTLQEVYRQLLQLNAPVQRFAISAVSIYGAVTMLKEKLNGSLLKQSQVAIVFIEMKNLEKLFDPSENSYKVQLLTLKIKEYLVKLCQNLNGCYISDKGYARYEIFASRGLLENNLHHIKETLNDISLYLNIEMLAGIGFGITAFAAQSHAYRATMHCRDNPAAGNIIKIDSDGTITEAIGQPASVSYLPLVTDAALMKKLTEAKVGIKTYQKVLAVIANMKWTSFTSAELAAQLAVTERSARRTLAGLNAVKLINCVGEEALSNRGRPTRKYQLPATEKYAK